LKIAASNCLEILGKFAEGVIEVFWNEPNFREWKPDSLHLRDSPRKRLSRAIPLSSGTNPYNTGIKEELHNIITTSEYISSAQAGYKSDMTESRKVKHLRSGSIEAKRL
jgi:hypothetical protein